MENVRLKTVDVISQNLLRSATNQGLELSWDRYERLQPQDGFLRVGLSCPFGCMQGPCRIDPFRRGPDRGICGLGRDGMVAALLLRLTLQGALEAMNDLTENDFINEIAWSSPLDRLVSHSLENLGGKKLSLSDVAYSAFLLNRPLSSPDSLILQALRMGLLTLGLLENRKRSKEKQKSLQSKVGYGILATDDLIVGVCGKPSQKLIETLLKEASREMGNNVTLVSLGDWIPLNDAFLPFVCTSGEAELLMSSGRINLLLTGPEADPSIWELCKILAIPCVSSRDNQEAKTILRLARQGYERGTRRSFSPDPSLVREFQVLMGTHNLEKQLREKPASNLAILGGADMPQLSLGSTSVDLTAGLVDEGFLVAGWGDTALWMIKNGDTSGARTTPFQILDPQQGPLLALKALALSGKPEALKGICFTGLSACKDLAMALGLATLGIKVCVAVPLPLWGSEQVCHILKEKLGVMGGLLSHFDHPLSAQETLEWFMKQS